MVDNRAAYAGFWIRLVAYIFDAIILTIFHFFILFVFGFDVLEASESASFSLFSFVISLLYFSGFESSEKRATPGKIVCGLVVIDAVGGRVSFLQAMVRFFSKILSCLLFFLGFIMIGFTSRKRGLHDFIARTYVIEKGEERLEI